jgi:hypothetical protein
VSSGAGPAQPDPLAGRSNGASAADGGPSGEGDAGPLLPGVTPEKALGGAFAGGVLAAFLIRWVRS